MVITTGGNYRDDKGTVMYFPAGSNLGSVWTPVSSNSTPPGTTTGKTSNPSDFDKQLAAQKAERQRQAEIERLKQVAQSFQAIKDGSFFRFADSDNVYTKQNGQLVNYGSLDDHQFRQVSGGQSSNIIQRSLIAQADVQKSGTPVPSRVNYGGANGYASGEIGGVNAAGLATNPTPGNAWVSGNYALIKFAEDPDQGGPMNTSTVFLLDKSAGILRPFMSEQAFNNFFQGQTTLAREAASGTINAVHVQDLQPGHILGQYKLATNQSDFVDTSGKWVAAGVSPGGVVDIQSLGKRYGKPPAPDLIASILGSGDPSSPQQGQLARILDMIQSDPNIGLASGITTEILNNPELVAKYVNALAYGGYSPYDIMLDVKRYDAAKRGDTQAGSAVVIDTNTEARDYYNTAAYKAANSYPNIQLPSYLTGIDMAEFKYPIFQLPNKAFTALTEPVDWTSPDAKAQAEQISAAFYDIMDKQLSAQTEQAKAVADSDYQQFKQDVLKKYGLYLSDDANSAWDQLQQMFNSASSAGILNTGMFQGALDEKLKDIRRADQKLRDAKATDEDMKKKSYYQSSATPAEIAALSPEDRVKYGLIPSNETKAFFTRDNLKSLYPQLTDNEITTYINSVLDENGNYRSQLYQNYMLSKQGNMQSKSNWQMAELLRRADTADQKAQRAYDTAGLGESAGDTTGGATPTPGTPGVPSVYDTIHDPSSTQTPPPPAPPAPPAPPTPPTGWTPPSGYTKIPNVAEMVNYTKIISEPNSINKWGIRKTGSTPLPPPQPPAPPAPPAPKRPATQPSYITNPTYITLYKSGAGQKTVLKGSPEETTARVAGYA